MTLRRRRRRRRMLLDDMTKDNAPQPLFSPLSLTLTHTHTLSLSLLKNIIYYSQLNILITHHQKSHVVIPVYIQKNTH
jgi:hypothetical protein